MGIGKDIARAQRQEDDATVLYRLTELLSNPELDLSNAVIKRDSVRRNERADPSYSTRIRIMDGRRTLFEYVLSYWGEARFPVAETRKFIR